jgi:hypothetical protein
MISLVSRAEEVGVNTTEWRFVDQPNTRSGFYSPEFVQLFVIQPASCHSAL